MTTSIGAEDPDVRLVELDGRNRISLNGLGITPRRRYVVTTADDGTITLEPAVVLTALERAYLANSKVQAIVEHGRANPQNRKKWTRRQAAPKRPDQTEE
jgi:hypothetical protein